MHIEDKDKDEMRIEGTRTSQMQGREVILFAFNMITCARVRWKYCVASDSVHQLEGWAYDRRACDQLFMCVKWSVTVEAPASRISIWEACVWSIVHEL